MLRFMRVLGIVASAGLMALSVYSIRSMHRSGELFQEYNTSGRSKSALLVFSLLTFGGLSFLEINKVKRSAEQKRYGQDRKAYLKDKADVSDSSNIYSAPNSVDEWASKQLVTMPKKNHGAVVDFPKIWLGVLTLVTFVLPLIYSGALAWLWTSGEEASTQGWMVRGYMAGLIFFSLLAAGGILFSRIWGLVFGYILSIFNFLIFPYGIVVGLFLLVCLAGSNAAFIEAAQKQKNKRRHRARKRMRTRLA